MPWRLGPLDLLFLVLPAVVVGVEARVPPPLEHRLPQRRGQLVLLLLPLVHLRGQRGRERPQLGLLPGELQRRHREAHARHPAGGRREEAPLLLAGAAARSFLKRAKNMRMRRSLKIL